MTRLIMHTGPFCRVVKVASGSGEVAYVVESHLGFDAMGVPQWGPVTPTRYPEVVTELAKMLDLATTPDVRTASVAPKRK